MLRIENIIVRFRDYHNRDAAGEDVWMGSRNCLPLEVRMVGGQERVFTKLSDLLPAALNESSPIKGECLNS